MTQEQKPSVKLEFMSTMLHEKIKAVHEHRKQVYLYACYLAELALANRDIDLGPVILTGEETTEEERIERIVGFCRWVNEDVTEDEVKKICYLILYGQPLLDEMRKQGIEKTLKGPLKFTNISVLASWVFTSHNEAVEKLATDIRDECVHMLTTAVGMEETEAREIVAAIDVACDKKMTREEILKEIAASFDLK